MVPFKTFWERLKTELARFPQLQPGTHVRMVRKWSEFSGYFGSDFVVMYRGGNVIHCDTATTNNVRTGISTAGFRKVYEAWQDYRSRRVGRSYIVHDLGVQNATWI